jgi:hypothetical protein
VKIIKIPAGVYPEESKGRNDVIVIRAFVAIKLKNCQSFYSGVRFN